MAKQAIFEQEGKTIDYLNGGQTSIEVGTVVPLVSRIGISLETIAPGAKGGVRLVGVWSMPADDQTAFTVGDQLYWDATNEVLTKTATDNIPAGICTLAKAASGTEASVRIG